MQSDSSLSFQIESSSPNARPLDGRRIVRRINDTTVTEEAHFNASEIANFAGVPDRWDPGQLWNLKYIDDGLNGEKLCNINAVSHNTCKKEVKYLHAKKSEDSLKLTMSNAGKIGMKINADKTQMLCITVARNSLINSFITLNDGETITGANSMKMLGHVFGRRPTAEAHVTQIKKNFF